jgi:hypothetical protein
VSNGGSLEVESLPGQGATFAFELPLHERSDMLGQTPEEDQGTEREQGPEQDRGFEPVQELEQEPELELAGGATRTSPAPGSARQLLALGGSRRRGS